MSAAAHVKLAGIGIFFLAILFIGGCGTPAGNPDAGKKWYAMNNCSSCHGPNGNDGRAANIAGLEMSFGSFVRKLRRTNAPIMPYFPESKITEQDAADIYAYLKTLPR